MIARSFVWSSTLLVIGCGGAADDTNATGVRDGHGASASAALGGTGGSAASASTAGAAPSTSGDDGSGFGSDAGAIGAGMRANNGSAGSGGLLSQEPFIGARPPDLPSDAELWVGLIEHKVSLPGDILHNSTSTASGDVAERVVIVLHHDGTSGAITFGDAPPPPAPTDPDVAYPPFDQWYLVSSRPTAGFVYDTAVMASSGTLTLTFVPAQVSADWCALQTSYETVVDDVLVYMCLPLSEVESGRVDTTVSPQQVACFSTHPICGCDAFGCFALQDQTHAIDLAVDGDTMQGQYRDANLVELRLRRVP